MDWSTFFTILAQIAIGTVVVIVLFNLVYGAVMTIRKANADDPTSRDPR
jgi:hypothetical protein